MRQLITLIPLIFFPYLVHAQVTFDKGYFIDNENQVTNCWILNTGKDTNPTSIRYKISPEESTSEKKKIDDIKEFGIGKEIKFIRTIVNIDRSYNGETRYLDNSPEPKFRTETLFLRVLLEGGANLYRYEEGMLLLFFYSLDTIDDYQQLIYKKYLLPDSKLKKTDQGKMVISANNKFRLQLMESMACNSELIAETQDVAYTEKALVDFFEEYSICKNATYKVYKRNRGGKISAALKVGFRANRMKFYIGGFTEDLGSGLSPRFGGELEWLLPGTRNKWSLFAEPTIHIHSGQVDFATREVTFNNSAFDLATGFRHSIFLSERSRIFLNFGLGTNIARFQDVQFRFSSGGGYVIKSYWQFFTGAGIEVEKRIGLELRYAFKEDFLEFYFDRDAAVYNYIEVAFSLRLF